MLSIDPTNKFQEVRGVNCRIWQGRTPSGATFHVYVAAIDIPAGSENDPQFKELPRLDKVPAETIRFK